MTKPKTTVAVRLGPLYDLLADAAADRAITISAEIRRRLAESLGQPEPDLPRGNPDIAAQSARGNAARWARRKSDD